MNVQRISLVLVVSFCLSSVASAQEAKPAPAAEVKINYEEHIRPIFREHCFACHALDRAKGGLTLDTYQKVMTGGSSGEIVIGGDSGSSRLWALTNHSEEPKMPPMQDKLPSAKLALIQKWIDLGALESAGSKASVSKKPNLAFAAPVNIGKPEGPPPMPEGLLRQPVAYTPRAGQVSAMATSPWAPLVAVGGQKQVALFHSETNELVGIVPFPEGVPQVVRFSRNGSWLLIGGGRGGQSGCVVLVDVKTGRRVAKLGDELDAVLAADVSANHQFVAMSGPGKIVRIYSVATGELLHEIKKHTDWVYSCEFSPDGVLLATGDRSSGLFVWEADTAREYLGLRGHNGAIFDVSWRGDGNMLASSGEDGTIRLWEMEDGKQVKQWAAHNGGAFCVKYAHDGRLCTAGRDNTVKSWTGDGIAIKTYPAFTEQALRCAFTHDDKRIVGGDWLGNVKLWDVTEAKEIAGYTSNPGTLEIQAAVALEEIKAKQTQFDQVAKETADMEKALADRAAVAKTAAEKAAAVAAEPAKIEVSIAEAKKAQEGFLATLKTAQDQVGLAEDKFKASADKPEEKAALEQALAAAKENVAKAQTAASENEKKVAALAATLPAAQDAIKAASAEAAQREKERAEFAPQVVAKRNAAAEAKRLLEVAQAREAKLQQELIAFREFPAKLDGLVAEAQRKAIPLRTTIEQAAAERKTLEKRVADEAASVAAMLGKIEALKAELAKLEAQKKAADDAVAAKQAALKPTEDALGEVEAVIERALQDRNTFAEAYGKK